MLRFLSQARCPPAVEKHLVHEDEQFPAQSGVELTSEVLVGVEGYIAPEEGFEEVEERALARVALL